VIRRLLPSALAALLLAASSAAGAQGTARPPAAGRPALDRLAAAVQRQLGLGDEQGRQLRDATRRFATQRDQLMTQERATRLELRANVMRGDSADQPRIAQLMDQLVAHQRRRVELVAEEQRELARFLTPLQRAQFLAMQERALRAAQQLRAERAARGRGAGDPPADPPASRPGRRPVPEP
jgi:periplasmic protein CpxP/Spy